MKRLEQLSVRQNYIDAPIYIPVTIRNLIEKKEITYPPFLNLNEGFWSKVKAGIKGHPLDLGDLLTSRIWNPCYQG
jgi:hypothetical protein